MIAFIAFTDAGAALAKRLQSGLAGQTQGYAPEKYAKNHGLYAAADFKVLCSSLWKQAAGIVFIGAAGIAVRTIAPLVKSKTEDPAVIVMDERGENVISLLSGHIGGGNALAHDLAVLTGGRAIITTATDVNGKFAVDVFAARNGLTITSMKMAKEIAAAILDKESVGFFTTLPVHGQWPEELSADQQRLNIEVGFQAKRPNSLLLIPQSLCLGIGCRRGTTREQIEAAVDKALADNGLPQDAICAIASIDLKEDEQGLLQFARQRKLETCFYTAEDLMAQPGEFTRSPFVEQRTGVDCVCERAAVLASQAGSLVMKKTVLEGVTVAAAVKKITLKIGKED